MPSTTDQCFRYSSFDSFCFAAFSAGDSFSRSAGLSPAPYLSVPMSMSACQPVRSLPLKIAVKPSFASAAGTLLSVAAAGDVQVRGGGGGVCGPRPRPRPRPAPGAGWILSRRRRGSGRLTRGRARSRSLRLRPNPQRQRGEDGEHGQPAEQNFASYDSPGMHCLLRVGPHLFSNGAGAPPPAPAASRIRAPRRLKALTRRRSGARRLVPRLRSGRP